MPFPELKPLVCESCLDTGLVPDYDSVPDEFRGDVDVGSLPDTYCLCPYGLELAELDPLGILDGDPFP